MYTECPTCRRLYASAGVCPTCTTIRDCRCGTAFFARVDDDQRTCPRCQPVYYTVDGRGVKAINIRTLGIGNNVTVLVEDKNEQQS